MGQYGTKVIPSTLRDATVILDGILDNQTELQIQEHVADTSGYTEATFALFSLLGLQFSPRIRDLGRQRLYRLGEVPPGQARRLLKGKINTDLIKRHWDDLLRLAGSLKGERVPASLMVSRLQSAPRKNPLVRALQEYGRLRKTIFILKYLSDKTFRRYIQRQLNRGETMNGLRGYLFAGNEAEVRLPMLEDQNDQMSCLTILTNAVLLWNTTYFAALLKEERAKGRIINLDDLKYVWPTRFGHVNPFGVVTFPITETLARKELLPFRVSAKGGRNP
jgi:TnpA family transposase